MNCSFQDGIVALNFAFEEEADTFLRCAKTTVANRNRRREGKQKVLSTQDHLKILTVNKLSICQSVESSSYCLRFFFGLMSNDERSNDDSCRFKFRCQQAMGKREIGQRLIFSFFSRKLLSRKQKVALSSQLWSASSAEFVEKSMLNRKV